MSAADFDDWVHANGFTSDELAGAMAQWLAQHSGGVVIGVSEDGPTVIAVPDDLS